MKLFRKGYIHGQFHGPFVMYPNIFVVRYFHRTILSTHPLKILKNSDIISNYNNYYKEILTNSKCMLLTNKAPALKLASGSIS